MFPVVLPCKPHKNAARNVTPSTRRILIEELHRAASLLRGTPRYAPSVSRTHVFRYRSLRSYDGWPRRWEEVLLPAAFFPQFERFAQITTSAVSKKEHVAWSSFVESRLVEVVLRLEEVFL